MNGSTLKTGMTCLIADEWNEFVNILLDLKDDKFGANPIVVFLAEKMNQDIFWILDCMKFINAFDAYPETEIGYFMKYFNKGSDFWYDLYMVFEKNTKESYNEGLKKVFEIVAQEVK